MNKFVIHFTPCDSKREDRSTIVEASDHNTAIGLAVRKIFGRGRGFAIDSGLGTYRWPNGKLTQYGAITKGRSVETGRLRVDIIAIRKDG